jgi:hypothetical protein
MASEPRSHNGVVIARGLNVRGPLYLRDSRRIHERRLPLRCLRRSGSLSLAPRYLLVASLGSSRKRCQEKNLYMSYQRLDLAHRNCVLFGKEFRHSSLKTERPRSQRPSRHVARRPCWTPHSGYQVNHCASQVLYASTVASRYLGCP